MVGLAMKLESKLDPMNRSKRILRRDQQHSPFARTEVHESVFRMILNWQTRYRLSCDGGTDG